MEIRDDCIEVMLLPSMPKHDGDFRKRFIPIDDIMCVAGATLDVDLNQGKLTILL